MKKVLAVIMALMLMIPGLSALAADTADVYVTISDDTGALVLAQEKITVTDIDEDGALTIGDALYAAHEAKYEGGAAAGFATEETQYGLSMAMLWGVENGGSYGYYLNDASAWSLFDPIVDGDRINAYAYTDLTAWSDTYSYFDVNTVTTGASAETVLTLSMAGHDADWNPVTLPVEGAVITVNGVEHPNKTDAEGKVSIAIDAAGTYVISASSETLTLVPPVCILTVAAAEEPVVEEPVVEEPVVEEPAPAEPVAAPETGSESDMALYVVLFAAALVGIVVLTIKRRNAYEK